MTRYLFQALNGSPLEFSFPVLISQIGSIPQQSLRESEVKDLSRAQEKHFLVLLWQSSTCIHPVISEADFRAYYESLWASSTPSDQDGRIPSVLVNTTLFVNTFGHSGTDGVGADRGRLAGLGGQCPSRLPSVNWSGLRTTRPGYHHAAYRCDLPYCISFG
ncbi:hypothetical protein P170DRAFT_481367 [Aspergillus steynii IBT 23096]|uniref:Uncharacterized protein n=1 Tax=Aspergillus steynii IBT 23096 TaxID=1392250 RepID=A0A2I2FS10_9EURO|nr:uncharacterized protein P170DRAFT_481367 [Aspergillus steynii IBT 23096]PLB43420.1 hypothetical protein P170DRAFT_481367 [Aspergillus steynii IBT 23096]